MTELSKEVEEIKGRDLSPAMMEKAQRPKKTWFFERMTDKKIIPMEQREAWDICYNRSTWKLRSFRLVGSSDGTTYNKITKESMQKAHELTPQVEKKREELQQYQEREEKLIFDEAVDMEGDPEDKVNEENKVKVLRFRKIMDRIHEELDTLETELQKHVTDVVNRAVKAELEVAKKNQANRIAAGHALDWPEENANIQTPDAGSKQRNKILGVMEGRRG